MRWYMRTGTRPSSLAWTLAGSGGGALVAATEADGCTDTAALVAGAAAEVTAADVAATTDVAGGAAVEEPLDVHAEAMRTTEPTRAAVRTMAEAAVRRGMRVPALVRTG
ncbi:hypothetical protein acdb102_38900 [Acidothermaceae bacterium B102]|nr:hypothetical protein acdb102_38900 [Acidothermaceae bacterium B102]